MLKTVTIWLLIVAVMYVAYRMRRGEEANLTAASYRGIPLPTPNPSGVIA